MREMEEQFFIIYGANDRRYLMINDDKSNMS